MPSGTWCDGYINSATPHLGWSCRLTGSCPAGGRGPQVATHIDVSCCWRLISSLLWRSRSGTGVRRQFTTSGGLVGWLDSTQILPQRTLRGFYFNVWRFVCGGAGFQCDQHGWSVTPDILSFFSILICFLLYCILTITIILTSKKSTIMYARRDLY